MPPPLTDGHKVFIQALISRGPLAEEEVNAIFSGVTGKNPGDNQSLFMDYLLKINKELSYINCEVRGSRNQNDGRLFYGFVNSVADEESKLGTKYSVPQIAFYKGILEAILQDTTAQGTITNVNALYVRLENQVPVAGSSQDSSPVVPAAFKSFSVSQREKTLEELVQDKWLYATEDGRICLGVRSFLDLRGWFRSNDVPSCEVCNEAAIKAQLCPNEECTVRIHDYCLRMRFSQKRVKKACPKCDCQWKLSVQVAEEQDDETDIPIAVLSQPPSGTKKKRVRGSTSMGGEGVTIASSSSSQPPPQVFATTRVTRRAARLR